MEKFEQPKSAENNVNTPDSSNLLSSMDTFKQAKDNALQNTTPTNLPNLEIIGLDNETSSGTAHLDGATGKQVANFDGASEKQPASTAPFEGTRENPPAGAALFNTTSENPPGVNNLEGPANQFSQDLNHELSQEVNSQTSPLTLMVNPDTQKQLSIGSSTVTNDFESKHAFTNSTPMRQQM